MMLRMTARRWWVWAAIGAALLLVGSTQTWVRGTVTDPVLGASLVEATGAQAASTLMAGALLAGAALLAGLVGARPVRLVAAACLTGAGLLAGLPAIRALTSPADVARDVASDLPGQLGSAIQVDDAAATVWAVVGLVGAVLVLVGGLLCLVTWFRAAGHRSGGQPVPSANTRRERQADPWDDLTHGHDPTVDDYWHNDRERPDLPDTRSDQ